MTSALQDHERALTAALNLSRQTLQALRVKIEDWHDDLYDLSLDLEAYKDPDDRIKLRLWLAEMALETNKYH